MKTLAVLTVLTDTLFKIGFTADLKDHIQENRSLFGDSPSKSSKSSKSSKGQWLKHSNLTPDDVYTQLCLDVRKVCRKQLRVKRANKIRAFRDNKVVQS